MNKKLITIIGALIAIGTIIVGATIIRDDTSNNTSSNTQEEIQQNDKNSSDLNPNDIIDDDMQTGEVVAPDDQETPGVEESVQPQEQVPVVTNAGLLYTDYNSINLADIEQDNVVIFFKAAWCSTCNFLDRQIQANLESDESLAILTLDYDSETELKRKYGVNIQHTLVQVDKQGNQIKKWSGTLYYEDILPLIQEL